MIIRGGHDGSCVTSWLLFSSVDLMQCFVQLSSSGHRLEKVGYIMLAWCWITMNYLCFEPFLSWTCLHMIVPASTILAWWAWVQGYALFIEIGIEIIVLKKFLLAPWPWNPPSPNSGAWGERRGMERSNAFAVDSWFSLRIIVEVKNQRNHENTLVLNVALIWKA